MKGRIVEEKKFWIAMNEAIRKSDGKYVRKALADHPEMIQYNNDGTWLHTAAEEHQTEMIRLLVELGCNLEAEDDLGSTPLEIATSRDVPETVKTLLELGADPNHPGSRYPIGAIVCSTENTMEIIRLLDQYGADLTREYDFGNDGQKITALSRAIEYGKDDVAEFIRSRIGGKKRK